MSLHEKRIHWKVHAMYQILYPRRILLECHSRQLQKYNVKLSRVATWKVCSSFSCGKHGTPGTKCLDPQRFHAAAVL